jgi:hypothetical protein
MIKSFAIILAAIMLPAAQAQTVLVTSSQETDSASSVAGLGTKAGPVVIGTVASTTSVYEHSEVWEVVRRFSEECPGTAFVTNPATPHSLTIRTEYEKVPGTLMGTLVVYQLVLLDSQNNPLYVSKKNWLRREVKPVCKVIHQSLGNAIEAAR